MLECNLRIRGFEVADESEEGGPALLVDIGELVPDDEAGVAEECGALSSHGDLAGGVGFRLQGKTEYGVARDSALVVRRSIPRRRCTHHHVPFTAKMRCQKSHHFCLPASPSNFQYLWVFTMGIYLPGASRYMV